MQPQLNPFTRQPLRPGQRLPTAEQRSEAIQAPETMGAGFPFRPKWLITDAHAAAWTLHRFRGRRGAASLAALVGDEFGLFLTDLDCFSDLCRRGIKRPDQAAEYLRTGREEWGFLGPLLDVWRQMFTGEGATDETQAAVRAYIDGAPAQ